MANQFNPLVPAVKQSSSQVVSSLSHKGIASMQRAKALGLTLCLSLIPALGIGVTSYHFANQAVTKEITQIQPSNASTSSAFQKQLLLILTLVSGGTALLVCAITSLFYQRLSLRSSTPQNSQKLLLFGDIASQSQPVDLDYLYKRVVDGARDILRADRVIVYTFDADWNGTIVAESVGLEFEESLGHQIADTCLRGSKGGLYKQGRVCVINDIYQAGLSDCHIQLLKNYRVKANMVVPILKDDQLLGLIIAHQCDQPRVWQPDDIDLLVQLAALIALRLSRINFLEQKAKAGQERLFSNVAVRIRQCLDPEEVFNTATTEIRKALNIDRVVVCRLSPSLKDGSIVAESVTSGFPTMLGLELASLSIAESHLERFKKGYIHPINTLQESGLNNSDINLIEQYKVKASLVAPIWADNQLVGLMIAHQCSTKRIWEASTIDLFEELAAHAGLALEQTTLVKSVGAERQRTELLADFTTRIRQSFNSKDIFSTSVDEIRNTLKSDRVLIYRFNPDGKTGDITAQSVAPNYTSIQKEKINKLFQAENFQGYKTGSVWVIHDVYDNNLTPAHAKLIERLQIKASMVAPIVSDGQLVGLLCTHQCSEARDWQQSEFYLFKQLAAQIGFALDQAKLIEQVKVVSQQQQDQSEELRHQLMSLVKEVEEVTNGDLTVRADVVEGEIGTVADFFNVVIENFREIVKRVKIATTQVNASLGENESSIRQLADVAFKQAQETTRTLDSVEQMTRSIQEVADSAHHAAAVARSASKTAEVGTEAMAYTAQKIMTLRETVAETAKKVKRLGESSQEISKVVSLINQIALQTNLLALNAGIEAARAGEDGKSFSVVAKEIGELAARSSIATKEIEQIVETIQVETNETVEAMEQGTIQVVEGTQLVEDTKQSLSRILDVSRQIDQLVQSISGATVSQAKTSQSVTNLIKEMAKLSEQTSKSSHQISSSLQETVEVAQQLQASVEIFKVDSEET
ncbi:MAG TPA: GAF domain-containing protein [Coleofasciculaceae cyanobacterium]|jgi:methyl-accepting chemotaxis protein PixJ